MMNRLKFYLLAGLGLILTGLSSCGDDDSISAEDQLKKDIGIIDQYLEDHSIDAVEHPSGLRYVITNDVFGEHPEGSDLITINYEGRLLSDNSVFDSGEDSEFRLSGLILGWQIGLPLIAEGGSITLYIPSGYAYGAKTQGGIPPNSNLIFDIDLLKVK